MAERTTAELIAHNRALLALAADTRACTRDAIERAEDAVQRLMQIRLAWAKEPRPQDDPPRRSLPGRGGRNGPAVMRFRKPQSD